MESGILQKCLSPPSYLSDPKSGDESNAAVEEGNETSTVKEEEIIILAESVHAPAQSQPSLLVNDIPTDVSEETVGTQNIRESDPEREVVSFTLVLNRLCAARIFPTSVLSVVY